MGSGIKSKLIAACGIILVDCLLSPGCHGKSPIGQTLLLLHDLPLPTHFLKRISGASSTVPSRPTTGNDPHHPRHHPRGSVSVVPRFETKAKLVGFNRAVGERLQRTETDLRPLQRRAARLERLVNNFQHKRRTSGPALQRKDATNAERTGLLREANRLRADVDRKLLGFRELDRNYRNVRQLLPTAALPRAWLDRDTERQMEQNERVYKTIINLLVQLIEVPVNIIHEIIGEEEATGTGNGAASSPGPNDTTDDDDGVLVVTEQPTPGNDYVDFEYDEPETAINAVDGEAGEGPANVVQDAEWVQFHY
uniref:Putative secreted protein n=1 Tax=Anopheles marajoara TaxID=58244 RepID=A0A2M4BVU2_9DIPT